MTLLVTAKEVEMSRTYMIDIKIYHEIRLQFSLGFSPEYFIFTRYIDKSSKRNWNGLMMITA